MPDVDDQVDDPFPATAEPLRRPRGRRRAEPVRPPENSRLTRRSVLLGAGGATTVLGTGCAVRTLSGGSAAPVAQAAAPAAVLPPRPAAPVRVTPTATPTKTAAPTGLVLAKNLDPALLVARVSYGRTAKVEEAVEAAGMTKWLGAQLAPEKMTDPEGDALRKLFPRLKLSPKEVRGSLKEGDWAVMTDTAVAHVGQAVWSRRQLLEQMVDLWSNVLNVTCPSSDVWDTRHRYDRDVIRKHALGRFDEMLLASAFHPSMLNYLDNARSTKDEPNENYGRELLELHTVGKASGYREKDVQQAALLLTGWTVEDGEAKYDPERHHVGKIRVLDFSHANSSASGGKKAQTAYLSYLATHPATAGRIARRLAVRFVSDDPPEDLVKRLAQVYLAKGTAIVPVLEALFSSPEFTASAGEKVRRPFETLAATLRVIGVDVPGESKPLVDLYWMLQAVGHQPLGWAPPDGYSDVAASWQSPAAAMEQFNTTATLVHGWWPDRLGLPGPEKLLSRAPTSRSGVVDAAARALLGRGATSSEKSAASALLTGTRLPKSFAAGSWEQHETVALTSILLLTSPAHLTR